MHGTVLLEMVKSQRAYTRDGTSVPLGGVIRDESAEILQRIIETYQPRSCLEVGMAMGMSTLSILYALAANGGGTHVAIDPHQRAPRPDGYDGIGIAMVARAGLSDTLTLIEQPSYLALPRLLAEGRRYDLILIDGYHTFDYAFVDYFYADLLLNDGGILLFDDVLLPQIHKVCWFLETHKAYTRLGPRITHPLNPLFRLKRRLSPLGSRGGDRVWGGFQGYRKDRTTVVRPLYFHTGFYPYFAVWWVWKRLASAVGRLRGFPGATRRTPF